MVEGVTVQQVGKVNLLTAGKFKRGFAGEKISTRANGLNIFCQYSSGSGIHSLKNAFAKMRDFIIHHDLLENEKLVTFNNANAEDDI